MIKCMTCDQPIPEGEEHPPYIAQYRLSPHIEDLGGLGEETDDLLRSLHAVLQVVPEAGKIDEDLPGHLLSLARELSEEAQRRLPLLRTAADIWQKRAAGREPIQEGSR